MELRCRLDSSQVRLSNSRRREPTISTLSHPLIRFPSCSQQYLQHAKRGCIFPLSTIRAATTSHRRWLFWMESWTSTWAIFDIRTKQSPCNSRESLITFRSLSVHLSRCIARLETSAWTSRADTSREDSLCGTSFSRIIPVWLERSLASCPNGCHFRHT